MCGSGTELPCIATSMPSLSMCMHTLNGSVDVRICACMLVFCSKGTSKNEKAKAIAYGALFLSREGRPATTPVVRLVEGGETTAFDSCFDGAYAFAVLLSSLR